MSRRRCWKATLTLDGETKTLGQWSAELNIPLSTLQQRVKKGEAWGYVLKQPELIFFPGWVLDSNKFAVEIEDELIAHIDNAYYYEALDVALRTLNPMEQQVIRLRHGIDVEEQNPTQIGRIIGRSRQNVWNIEAAGLRKLRKWIKMTAFIRRVRSMRLPILRTTTQELVRQIRVEHPAMIQSAQPKETTQRRVVKRVGTRPQRRRRQASSLSSQRSEPRCYPFICTSQYMRELDALVADTLAANNSMSVGRRFDDLWSIARFKRYASTRKLSLQFLKLPQVGCFVMRVRPNSLIAEESR
jgi:hypothetical protein